MILQPANPKRGAHVSDRTSARFVPPPLTCYFGLVSLRAQTLLAKKHFVKPEGYLRKFLIEVRQGGGSQAVRVRISAPAPFVFAGLERSHYENSSVCAASEIATTAGCLSLRSTEIA
jgi:hypothetical protein